MSEYLAESALDDLVVIDRLEVGPLKLEKRRLIAPYIVIQGDQVSATELIYSYEENVFDPAEKASQNLAAMIAAQVAINYGLFCRTIVFHGLFDRHDKAFIHEMIENTACEIYVNKLLAPNPFLVGAAKNIAVEQREKFSRARIVFSGDHLTARANAWENKPHRFAILSSGGKDSLLSFGLINELGYETHAIFGNESGRHWFTALNAYRYFKKNFPNTGRVWMNSDRVFAWMLRRLPFIPAGFCQYSRRYLSDQAVDGGGVSLWYFTPGPEVWAGQDSSRRMNMIPPGRLILIIFRTTPGCTIKAGISILP